jgi:putative transposase
MRTAVSELMRDLAREFARTYSRRKSRTNAFWGDNYHAMLVEDGS